MVSLKYTKGVRAFTLIMVILLVLSQAINYLLGNGYYDKMIIWLALSCVTNFYLILDLEIKIVEGKIKHG